MKRRIHLKKELEPLSAITAHLLNVAQTATITLIHTLQLTRRTVVSFAMVVLLLRNVPLFGKTSTLKTNLNVKRMSDQFVKSPNISRINTFYYSYVCR